jgi:hypothetical protein
VKENDAREIVRTLAADEPPVPAWTRVTMRATFEDQLAARRAPFKPLIWIETAIYVVAGFSLAALVLWMIFAL